MTWQARVHLVRVEVDRRRLPPLADREACEVGQMQKRGVQMPNTSDFLPKSNIFLV